MNAFRHFERLVETTDRVDDHVLRRRLIDKPALEPWRHVVLAVGDDTIDRQGLFPADWDLLTRIHGLERIDIVATDAMVAGAFHERIHQRLPGIEEARVPLHHRRPPPVLVVSHGGAPTHTARDREEEVERLRSLGTAGDAQYGGWRHLSAGSDGVGRSPPAAVRLPRAGGTQVGRNSLTDV